MSQHAFPDIATEVWYNVTQQLDSPLYFQEPFFPLFKWIIPEI